MLGFIVQPSLRVCRPILHFRSASPYSRLIRRLGQCVICVYISRAGSPGTWERPAKTPQPGENQPETGNTHTGTEYAGQIASPFFNSANDKSQR